MNNNELQQHASEILKKRKEERKKNVRVNLIEYANKQLRRFNEIHVKT